MAHQRLLFGETEGVEVFWPLYFIYFIFFSLKVITSDSIDQFLNYPLYLLSISFIAWELQIRKILGRSREQHDLLANPTQTAVCSTNQMADFVLLRHKRRCWQTMSFISHSPLPILHEMESNGFHQVQICFGSSLSFFPSRLFRSVSAREQVCISNYTKRFLLALWISSL